MYKPKSKYLKGLIRKAKRPSVKLFDLVELEECIAVEMPGWGRALGCSSLKGQYPTEYKTMRKELKPGAAKAEAREKAREKRELDLAERKEITEDKMDFARLKKSVE